MIPNAPNVESVLGRHTQQGTVLKISMGTIVDARRKERARYLVSTHSKGGYVTAAKNLYKIGYLLDE